MTDNPWRKTAPPSNPWRKQAATPEGPGIVGGMLRAGAQGLTFGLSEELRGIGAAMVPGGDSYTTARDKEREALQTFRSAHPYLSGASELAGGVAPMLLTGGASAAVSGPRAAWSLSPALKELMKTGAKSGAKWGAPNAFGRAEGTPGEQLKQTAVGTVVGAGTGGTVPAVLSAGGWAGGGLRRAFGVPSAAATERGSDAMFERALSSTGQNIDDVTARAKAQTAAGMQPTVNEAMGPGGPQVIGQFSHGLDTKLGADGVSSAGRAARWADKLDEAREELKRAGSTRTGPKAAEQYQAAYEVGEVPLARATGGEMSDAQRMLQRLDEEFPNLHDDVVKRLTRRVEDGKLSKELAGNLGREGNHSVAYWDTFKKGLDDELYRMKNDPTSAMRREDLSESREWLGRLLHGVDTGVEKAGGDKVYLGARQQAERDISTRLEAEPFSKKTAQYLRRAGQASGPRVDPETAAAQVFAGRGKIAKADVGLDFLKAGVRKSAWREADRALQGSMRTDVPQFVQDILARSLAERQAGLSAATRAGRLSGGLMGSLAPDWSKP